MMLVKLNVTCVVPYEAKCSMLFDTKLLESQSIGQSFDAMCEPCEAKCNMLFDT